MSDPILRRDVRLGAAVFLAFFVGLGGWAVFARLASAAVAFGEIDFDRDRRTVQHLEGGIIDTILVNDGDAVAAGDVVLLLDRTQAEAAVEQLQGRYFALLATEARLIAERDAKQRIVFPEALSGVEQGTKITEIKSSEERLFQTRTDSLAQQKAIIRQSIHQLNAEIVGLREEILTQDRQIALLNDEVSSLEDLLEQKLVSKQRLLLLSRQQAELEGERSRNKAAIARAEQSISEQELRLIDVQTVREGETLASLREVQSDLLETTERLAAADDVLRRTVIRAPIAGTVVNLAVATQGGVIGSREALMDIVPQNETLLIKARIEPKDVDVVRAGQLALVRLTAFQQRSRNPLEGTVQSVSADSLVDEINGEVYYQVRVALPDLVGSDYAGLELIPGMQAEVLIQLGDRTPLDYLVRPIRDSMSRAMLEE